MDGKISLEAVQEYLDQAYRSNEIPQKADVRSVVNYSVLDEVLKER
jgi:hypothetical protein